MKDDLGLYYNPDPTDLKTRVYVREGQAGPRFRLWRADRPEVWERHDWLDWSVLEAAAAHYRARDSKSDPLRLYDLNVAKALIKHGR